jgi:PPOX class probable F420-dependent enzyme
MLNGSTDKSKHLVSRLEQDLVVWFTTVSGDGTPQPNPVWFYWDGESCLIYTRPGAAKLKNLARSARAAIHFEGAETFGGDLLILTGEARVLEMSSDPDPEYIQKYRKPAEEYGREIEEICSRYNVPIRFVPERVRTG